MRPCDWIVEKYHVRALWALFFATLIVASILDVHKPPDGWVCLEFPAWLGRSAIPPSQWTEGQRAVSLFGLGLDFLFLFLYPLFLSLLCSRASERWRLPNWLAALTGMFSFLILAAAPLDALENIGLYWLIAGADGEALQWLITITSAGKWLIVLACLPVALAALIYRGYNGPDED